MLDIGAKGINLVENFIIPEIFKVSQNPYFGSVFFDGIDMPVEIKFVHVLMYLSIYLVHTNGCVNTLSSIFYQHCRKIY